MMKEFLTDVVDGLSSHAYLDGVKVSADLAAANLLHAIRSAPEGADEVRIACANTVRIARHIDDRVWQYGYQNRGEIRPHWLGSARVSAHSVEVA